MAIIFDMCMDTWVCLSLYFVAAAADSTQFSLVNFDACSLAAADCFGMGC